MNVSHNRCASQKSATTIANFLRYDGDPYLVVSSDGRLFWIRDAYTISSQYPYSTPAANEINYIRNSVKVVIDAYNGTTDFYLADPADPLAQTLSRIFPSPSRASIWKYAFNSSITGSHAAGFP